MAPEQDVLLEVVDLEKLFPVKKGVVGRVVGHVHAVDGVSLTIKRGETLGLVGESGCGKTTFGRAVLRLVEPTGGKIIFDGEDITRGPPSQLRSMRKRLQIVFQDPYSSLDPRMTVEKIVGEGFKIHGPPGDVSKNVRFAERERIHQLIEQVGLSHDHLSRLPHEFSGGQKQRIALARALALDPDFVVLDEPTSALDVSVQAQALNLLKHLQGRLGLTYLFISHDLSVVAHMSNRIAVMYLGKVIELAPAMKFLKDARHPYTQALIAAIPIPDPKMRKVRKGIEGEVPSPIDPPKGCRFRPRCPKAFEDCGWQGGDMVEWLEENGHLATGRPLAELVRETNVDGSVLVVRLKKPEDYDSVHTALERLTASVNHPLMKAIEAIGPLMTDRVIEISCGPAKQTAAEVAEQVEAKLCNSRDTALLRKVLPFEVKGRKVHVRTIGEEGDWGELKSLLEKHVRQRRLEGDDTAEALKGVTLKVVKDRGKVVAVKFKKVREPPLYDVGEGHQVACFLFK